MTQGLKKGQKHSGSFVKNDPRTWRGGPKNPTGRKQAFEDALKDKSPQILKYLDSYLEDDTVAVKDKIAICFDTLDRAHGKAVDRVLMSQVSEGSQTSAIGRMLAMLDEEEAGVLLETGGDDGISP